MNFLDKTIMALQVWYLNQIKEGAGWYDIHVKAESFFGESPKDYHVDHLIKMGEYIFHFRKDQWDQISLYIHLKNKDNEIFRSYGYKSKSGPIRDLYDNLCLFAVQISPELVKLAESLLPGLTENLKPQKSPSNDNSEEHF